MSCKLQDARGRFVKGSHQTIALAGSAGRQGVQFHGNLVAAVRGGSEGFDDGEYVRFDLAGQPQQHDTGPSYIRRRGSINALATGQRAVVAGGFRRSDNTASEYSGAGPVATPATIPPPRTGPDAAAVADD